MSATFSEGVFHPVIVPIWLPWYQACDWAATVMPLPATIVKLIPLGVAGLDRYRQCAAREEGRIHIGDGDSSVDDGHLLLIYGGG